MPKKEVRANGLILEDLKIGTGAIASCGKNIEVNYLGTLKNGTKFDSSYDRGQTFSFQLCAGSVIKGWDEGVQGMKVGGKRKLEIPAALGYGEMSVGTIPANSTLVFEVELVSVK
ncbi:MAG: FKBP-type peptidyl-prolyl cis-trans isomerase [Candidatus Pacebacteria bacterium]|nr:FKBP-type peptidyl-prolyl cis-trans isomerase [Candidatus Paceibacterota bacterium]